MAGLLVRAARLFPSLFVLLEIMSCCKGMTAQELKNNNGQNYRGVNNQLNTFDFTGAINIPLGQVDTEFAKSPRQLKSQYHRLALDEEGRNIVFFCKAGVRAEKALTTAQKHGYTKYVIG